VACARAWTHEKDGKKMGNAKSMVEPNRKHRRRGMVVDEGEQDFRMLGTHPGRKCITTGRKDKKDFSPSKKPREKSRACCHVGPLYTSGGTAKSGSGLNRDQMYITFRRGQGGTQTGKKGWGGRAGSQSRAWRKIARRRPHLTRNQHERLEKKFPRKRGNT